MRPSSCLAAFAALASTATTMPTAQSEAPGGLEEAKRDFEKIVSEITMGKMAELESDAKKDQQEKDEYRTCTAANLAIRKEYGDLTKEERLDYVNAVKCLMKLPARTPQEVAPGAKSRYDDFNVLHVQKTLDVHYTGNFQPWHRWFIFNYELALREECAYKGYQPYWDWAKYATAPEKSPIFNGDPYSLGGNGAAIPHDGPIIAPPPGTNAPTIQLPPGLGGGPVTEGPFANMTITLGPVALVDVAPGPMGGLGENPRPLKRDVGPAVNMRYANYSTVRNMLHKPDIDSYRFLTEGMALTGEIGPHGGGHYVIGQMDRMWTLWQQLDPSTRYTDLGKDYYAHQTWWNEPPSPLTSLDDVLDLGYVGPSITIREVMDTTKGPFCYFYQ
ncbi:hypothetical protein PspLS_06104 [Pyricularia sp. CBS 133598]|nr:hypothetical protein PspLS_06104 [Pyricularia sp. CBS 133598]